MADIRLSAIYFYPVKSLRGIGLQRAPLGRRGIDYDRHWMLVDDAGVFITQRHLPRMALISTSLVPGGLRLSAPGMPDLDVALESAAHRPLSVRVWDDLCTARSAGDAPRRWLSAFLDCACRLVYLPPDSRRLVDTNFAQAGEETGFSDGFPLLLISQTSLDDLNTRLQTPLPMQRFRPNLVVEGCLPYAEDGWRRIRVGDIILRLVKACSRCAITTVDPETGGKGAEPLRTLSGYRKRGNKVYFGQNLLHQAAGELRVGMPVEILEGD